MIDCIYDPACLNPYILVRPAGAASMESVFESPCLVTLCLKLPMQSVSNADLKLQPRSTWPLSVAQVKERTTWLSLMLPSAT